MYLFISSKVLDVESTNTCWHFMCVNYVVGAVLAIGGIETTFILSTGLASER